MTPAEDHRPTPESSNPFSTRFVRPGAIPYQFAPGDSASAMVDRLRASGWRGQIVGGHGTGKSTLLAAILPELRREGREPIVVALHDGTRRLPRSAWDRLIACRSAGIPAVVVIDGFEQLGPLARLRLRLACRRTRAGLLVTSHAPAGLPELARTAVDPGLARRIVAHLAPSLADSTELCDIEARLSSHGGNLREVLFDFYDRHERRCR